MTQLKAAHHLQQSGPRQLYLASVNVHGNVIYTVAPRTFCALGIAQQLFSDGTQGQLVAVGSRRLYNVSRLVFVLLTYLSRQTFYLFLWQVLYLSTRMLVDLPVEH